MTHRMSSVIFRLTAAVFLLAELVYAVTPTGAVQADGPTTYAISGNAGVSGAILSYTDGSPQTATSAADGSYSFTVSANWSGTVTPSLAGYTFLPASLTYTNVQADQSGQDYTATAITYTIAGNAGVAGATLSYTDGTDKTATSASDGSYSFTVSYNWSGTVTPSLTGYTFSPANLSYTNVQADQTGQNYTATAIVSTYTISGNAGEAGETLSYTDGSAKTATSAGDGSYSFTVSYNWSGTVTPSLTGYTFSPANRVYISVLSDQTGQDYTATAITYTISGSAGVAGATLSYTDGSAKTATADGSGNYSFTVSSNWSGTVTPSLAGYTFSPANRTYSSVQADQAGQDYTATATANTYTISGNTGVGGVTLSYTDGSAKAATTAADGSYSFSVSSNWSGTVTPSLAGYTFSPASLSYTDVQADQTGQDYTATAITYTISGNAGMAGATLSYTDGSAKTATSAADGNYSFTVSNNWSGTVTPSLAGYAFSPINQSYTNVQADQTGQDYTAAAVTYFISGNAGVAGAILSYTDGSAKTATSAGDGSYSFTVSYNWSGTVTPYRLGYTFSPVDQSYTNVLADQTDQNYKATLVGSISAGSSHTCWLKSDGTLACWGSNVYGESTPPVGIFLEVSAGGWHTCGVKSDGTLTCWGRDYDGESNSPAGTFAQVSAGQYHTCGLKSDGTLACWGRNNYGQSMPPAGTFVQVSAGSNHTCALKSDGTLACWGSNVYGESTPPVGIFLEVSAGGWHTCGVKNDDTLTCWGYNAFGQATPPAGTFTQVSAGDTHTCGLKGDGTLACWGSNDYGESTPPDGTLIQISTGNYFTCGLESDDTPDCWGYNNYGQSYPIIISGSIGLAGVTLSYTDRTLKTSVTNSAGSYYFAVSYNWSGTVAPSKAGYTFSPVNRSYTNLQASQVDQNYTATAITYTISGNAGIAGATLSYTDGTPKTTTSAADGSYSFTISYNWSGTVTPSEAGYTFSPLNLSYTNVLANQTGQNYTATAFTYAISGNAGIAGATLSYTDGTPKTATSAADGSYSFTISYNWSGTVIPSEAGYAFSPASLTYSNVLADQTGQNYTAIITYIISGHTGIAGATLSYIDGTPKTATSAADGSYSFTVSSNWSGTVTPSKPGYTFIPLNRIYTNIHADQITQNYIYTPLSSLVESISTGWIHTCELMSDGAIVCWGDNEYGQSTPPYGTFTQVSAGYGHTCGLKSDGTLACWGENDNGESTPPSGTFTQVSAGNMHTCGVKSDGTLACWGYNYYGQSAPPTGTFTQVSAGNMYTCGVKSSGTLACWGSNYIGQSTPPTGTFTQISAGDAYACGLKSNGTLACWGDNSYGQSSPPSGTFTQVSAGGYHACGLKGDGTLTCWGDNDDGASSPLSGVFTKISAGGYHSCGLKSDGNLICWGDNTYSQSKPFTISGNAGVAGATLSYTDGTLEAATADGSGNYSFAVSYNWSGTVTPSEAGYTFSPASLTYSSVLANQTSQNYTTTIAYAISGNAGVAGATLSYTDGTAKTATSAGDGNYSFTVSYNWSGTVTPSKIGYTFSPVSRTYTNVLANQIGQNYTAAVNGSISAGGDHTCGVKNDGTLACWGYNYYGQSTPPAGTFIQVSAGEAHTCGLMSDGTLTCWGYNYSGQSTPPAGTFTQVSAGGYHTCGLKSNGTLACWGNNSDGQATPPTGNFTQVSAGLENTCGLRSGGTLVCWGDNYSGQSTPPAGTFLQVSAGGGHTCGLKSDGTLACWGDNSDGQATPPAGTFIQVSAGFEHTCGLKSDGTLACWGDNSDGQATPPAGTFIQVSAGGEHTCGLMSDGTLACWGWNYFGQSNTLSISGSAAVAGAALSYTNGTLQTATSASDGSYSFKVPYGWSGTVTPSVAGYTFSPVSLTYTNVQADQTGQNYTATAVTYIISGNAGVAGATLSYTDGTSKTATSASDGSYSFTVSYNWSGTVTPSKPGYTFFPSSLTYSSILTNQTDQNYALIITISGNAGVAGATLSYTDGTPRTATSAADGSYSITVSYNWSGTITPSETGYTFSPVNRSFTNVLVDQTGQDYTATLVGIISAGQLHTCWLKSDGTLACWGFNNSGQSTPPAGTFTRISAGDYHNCGFKSDGTLTCWGDNSYGDSTPPAGSFTQVSAGNYYTCGLKSDGTLACWGDNSNGQATPPAGIFTQVSAGYLHTCGLESNGTLACWGENNYGQATPPTGIFTQVSAGFFHTCGLKSDGTLICWGRNDYGQATPPAGTFSQVSAGYLHTCGLKSDGTLVCWGAGTTNTGSFPNYGQSTPPAGTFIQVSAGMYHTCGLKSDGTLACWGDNTYRQSDPFSIWGNVGVAGATLSYIDGTPKTATSVWDGTYSFDVSYNWSGTVTPSLAGYSFSPANLAYTNVQEDQSNQNYTATVTTYTISGNVGVAGATLSYNDGSTKTATSAVDGSYSFTVSYNWSGTVTPYKLGYTFSPASLTYSNIAADQTEQNYSPTQLYKPSNGQSASTTRPVFDWPDTTGAVSYTLQVANNTLFSSPTINTTVTSSTYSAAVDLPRGIMMYWREHANFSGSIGIWSGSQNFYTANPPSVPSLVSPGSNALITSYSPTLTWSLVTLPTGTNFGHYELQLSTSSTFASTVLDHTDLTSLNTHAYTLTSGEALSPNTAYYLRVLAANTAGQFSSWSPVRSFRTVILPPTLSTPANVSNLLYNRPTFDWNDVPGASGYTFQIAKDAAFTQMVINTSVTPSTYTPTADLPVNLTLYWRVQAKGVNGPSAWSAVWNLVTANPPSVPSLVSPGSKSLITTYTPALSWSLVTLPTGTSFGHYELQVSTTNTFASTVLDHTDLTSIATHKYALTSGEALAPNMTYYWRVLAANFAGGYGHWSPVWSFRTVILPPALGTPVNTAALNYNRPTFDWNDVAGASGYTFQIAKDAAFTQMVTNTSVTPSTYTPTADLPVNLTLYWRVQAKGTNGPSSWSSVWSFLTANPPSVPSLVSPGSKALITSYTPTLAWSAVTLPTGTSFGHYELQVSTTNTFASTVLDHTDLTDLAAHQYTLSSGEALLPNTTYYWRVLAVNSAGGYGQWSPVWSFRTVIMPPALTAPDDASTSVSPRPNFSWGAVSGASSYSLQVSVNGTFTSLVVNAAVSATIYTPKVNLPVGTLYWRVRANGTNGPSSWSGTRSLVEQ